MPEYLASTIAGNKFATAVPDVVKTALGFPLLIEAPNARYAADLSSIRTSTFINPSFSAWTKANEIGPFREPGESATKLTPL